MFGIQTKAIEQYFHTVLLIEFYREVITSKSVDETLVCGHSNESYRAVLSNGTVCSSIVCKLNFGNIFHRAPESPLRGSEYM